MHRLLNFSAVILGLLLIGVGIKRWADLEYALRGSDSFLPYLSEVYFPGLWMAFLGFALIAVAVIDFLIHSARTQNTPD